MALHMTNPAHYTPPALAQDNSDDEIDLRDLIGSVVEGRWWIAGFTAVAFSIGVLYTFVATPIYEVNALVQVEDSKAGGLGAVADDLGELFETKAQASTEIELINSRMVLGKSVEDLHLDIAAQAKYFPVIGKLFAGNELRSISVTRFDVPRALQGAAFELIADASGKFQLIGPEGNVLGMGQVGKPFSSTWQDQSIGLFVRDLIAPVGQTFTVVKQNPLQAIAGVSANLSAGEQGKQTGMIKLTYKSPSADKASLILNQITNNYLRQNVERKSAEAQKTLQFLDEQLPEIKQKLEAAEVRFNDYRMRTGTLDISKEGELLLGQTVSAEAGLMQLQQQRKELLGRFTGEHPSVQVLDKQIAALQSQRGQFNQRVDKLPKTQQELLRLTRDLQVSQELYTTLLNNAQQLKVVRAGTVGNVRIIDAAQPTLRPIAPKKSMIVVLALLLGGMMGVGFVLLRQALRSGVKDAAQIEAKTGVSVLATVPASDAQEKLVKKLQKKGGSLAVLAHYEPNDLAIESLRSLRTSLHFALVDAPNNLLMITGPGPAVGKSFLSVNMAALLASTGERVLLIDADMRRGYLNEYFGAERKHGLSELIAQDLEASSVVRATGLENFDYVATGELPPNPAELLLHPRFEQFLKDMEAKYDRVIIDSPPVMAVTDAAIVGRHAGATLLVARFNQTQMREIELSLKRLGQAGVSVKGVLLNRVTAAAGGYGYGYKYAYAYKYEQRKR